MKYCEEYAALLDAYVDGELPADEMARVQAHLDTCPGCRAYVDDALAIRAAFPDVEDTEVPDDFTDRVMAAIREEPAPAQKKKAPWAKVLLPLAACCAIVVLLQNGVFQSRNSDTAAATTSSSSSESTTSTTAAADEDVTTGTTSAEPEARESSSLDDANSGEEDHSDAAESSANQAAKDTYATAVESLEEGADEDGWVEYGNVVFSSVVYLTPDDVGNALDGYEGKPYSNVNQPEDGVIGIGYALDQEDFERILDELGYPLGPMQNQDRTTDLSCIVVTDDSN